MGLSTDVVKAHIDYWVDSLSRGNRPYRKNWPSRLFRHEPLENTVKILQSGALLSRTDARDEIVRDIAPAEIIGSRRVAHDSVRLYFRPKSPTQYRIEGIIKPHEVYQERHAPVLMIMIFGAEDTLTKAGVRVSDGNMQSPVTRVINTDESFQTIPFQSVFHEGAFDPGAADITRRRCAEVLVPSPLPLEGNLMAVLCRSPAERATLLHLLGRTAEQWAERIRVFTQLGLFENRYAYLDTVDGGPDGVSFTIHPRRDGATEKTAMWVWNNAGEPITGFGSQELDPAESYISEELLEPGTYVVRFELEDCLAYEASFIVDELPF